MLAVKKTDHPNSLRAKVNTPGKINTLNKYIIMATNFPFMGKIVAIIVYHIFIASRFLLESSQ